MVVAVQEEVTAQDERARSREGREPIQPSLAEEQVHGRRSQEEGEQETDIPCQRSGMQVDREEQRVEHRALEIGGVRRTQSLIGIPEADVALVPDLSRLLRPRFKRPGRRPYIDPDAVGRHVDMRGNRVGAVDAGLTPRGAEGASSEDHRRIGEDHETAGESDHDDLATPPRPPKLCTRHETAAPEADHLACATTVISPIVTGTRVALRKGRARHSNADTGVSAGCR